MKSLLLATLAGLVVFVGCLLVLVPLSCFLVLEFSPPPPADAPHGGGLVVAGRIGMAVICDIGIAAVLAVLVARHLDEKWFEPTPKPRSL